MPRSHDRGRHHRRLGRVELHSPKRAILYLVYKSRALLFTLPMLPNALLRRAGSYHARFVQELRLGPRVGLAWTPPVAADF